MLKVTLKSLNWLIVKQVSHPRVKMIHYHLMKLVSMLIKPWVEAWLDIWCILLHLGIEFSILNILLMCSPCRDGMFVYLLIGHLWTVEEIRRLIWVYRNLLHEVRYGFKFFKPQVPTRKYVDEIDPRTGWRKLVLKENRQAL